jgi:DNA replication initiation complex subunit (GINS family)
MYSELYKAWKSEKTTDQPQPLPADFYKRAHGYLKGLETDSTSTDVHTLQGRLLQKEMGIAHRLLNELREQRLQKIMSLAKRGAVINPQTLTEEEQALVKIVTSSISEFNMEQTEQQIRKSELTPEFEADLAVVRFLEDIPEIVGVDLKIYGPYKKEDVGSLPKENAIGLIKQGAAKLVEVKGVA